MNASIVAVALAILGAFLSSAWTSASGQGFAGLGTEVEGFALPATGVELNFPADHGSHPQYRIEWWYLTANLKGEDGKEYGAQWTLFRSALAPATNGGWTSPQIWMGHAAITSQDRQFSAQRLSRDGIDQAGVTADRFSAWIDDWSMQSRVPAGTTDVKAAVDLSKMSVRAAGVDFSYDLSLDAHGPIVRHGDDGYSVKSPKGQASYYYSQPFYDVSGTITLPEGAVRVSGKAWLDHEWSSQPLAADQTGWDWFSLHFDGGQKLMGFRLRDGGEGFTSATWVEADGSATSMLPGDLSVEPLGFTNIDGKSVPTQWRLRLPKRNLALTTRPLNPRAWMKTQVEYWEGPIIFDGTDQGKGYLEMTGY